MTKNNKIMIYLKKYIIRKFDKYIKNKNKKVYKQIIFEEEDKRNEIILCQLLISLEHKDP